MFKHVFIFTTALISSLLAVFILSSLSLKYKILKTRDIPLTGGLGIGIAFIFSLGLGIFIFNLSIVKVIAVACASLLMLFFGVIDDLKELSVGQKLLVQSFCAILLIIFGVKTNIIYFSFWGNAIVTFFAILLMTNAFNLLDIMDGLAAGTALIVSSAFLLIGFLSADLNVQIFSLILVAASAGFLIFNFPLAKVYLGNSGSHFLGLLIAAVALSTHYASSEKAFALLSPVMILGLPIIDTLLLIIFRVIKRKLPFNKSKDHLALKIKALGFSPVKTILIMYLLCSIFAACGVILTRVNNLLAAGIITGVFVISLGIFLKLIKIEAND